MTTDTLSPEVALIRAPSPTGCYLTRTEVALLRDHPEWTWVRQDGVPARQATEVEAAAYAARHADDRWSEIYNPAEPRIILPPSAPEITAMLEPAPEPEAIEGVALPDHPDLAEIQDNATKNLERWGAKTGPLSVVRDEPEDHHEKTVVIQAVPEDAA